MYEYKVVTADSDQVNEEQLNRFGQEGWQLVAVLRALSGGQTHYYYFKRYVGEPDAL